MSDKSYLAAPYRNSLSATAKAILNHQLLSIDETHLDYGCGRGGDVERLITAGYRSVGYDPHYFPSSATPADVVTMGYVLNVIENPQQRRQALAHAWNLTKKRLIVSTNVRGCGIHEGEYTRLGTFTKFYNHIELKAYIESTLGFEAVKLGKDKFVIHRNGHQFTPLCYEKILEESKAIATDWIPGMDVIIKGYCNDFKPRAGIDNLDDGEFPGRVRHYRLLAKSPCLPGKTGLVRCLHIRGGIGSEHMEWAIAALKRRNKIAEMKFHCIEQSFLNEFLGIKNFDFLNENIKIYR
ncbi:hypothetical protein [Nostoc sp. 2RC]|uniref:hypothetical protein n=1 Tax=Nostoc sp. 2RC TaxID=2485484 RepID=UPI00162600C2|nr:hypothetical protein [Nostoc sp. 2RC]MBC1237574.1 hypothetical protein [Nostoc sp. 2RC]